MVRNLNAINFQSFGSVLSERGQPGKPAEKRAGDVLELQPGNVPMYHAQSETLISNKTGLSVLSVSLDGENFLHFYLDKSASVKEGIYYALIPIQGESAVLVHNTKEPVCVGSVKPQDIAIKHQMWVDSIYTFFYQEKEQGFLFPGESHEATELTYVDQGSLHSVVDGQDTLLKQGDLVIYGPGQWHMQYSDIGVAPRFVTISFNVAGGSILPLLNQKFTAPQHTVTLLQKMLREQENMDHFSNDIIISYLNLLLNLLMREEDTPRAGKLQTSNAIHSENEIIRQAQIFINSHIREKLSVPLVARQVDVSPSYLTALFHKNLQIPPGEYIRRIKLQESKQMIRENNLNFTEIAAALQYSTVHHFSRQFKEKFGITPTEYAKSVR